jgi:PAS domain S-box-containing protein
MESIRGASSLKTLFGALAVYLVAGACWVAGSDYLVANTAAGDREHLALGVYWLIFFGASGAAFFLLLRRANAAAVEAAQGALDGSLRYEDLFEHHPTPMWVYDSMTRQFLAVNDAAMHRYGYTEAEFLAMSLRDIRPEEDVPEFLAHHTNTTRKGYGDAGVWRHRTKSGELLHMHISLNRTTYRGRKGTLVMAREVTEDVESREALEALKNSLEERVQQRTSELESANLELDAFARSAAHDLRTPLNGIMGFAQILQHELAGAGPVQRDSLERINRCAQSMLNLIDGLLVMSRVAQKAMTVEQVDLSSAATDSLQQLRDIEPARHVVATVQTGLGVDGDPTLLSSLLGNLLSNAWKFTSRRDPARVEFGAQVLPDGTHAYFVRDNGVGFPMEQAERLFKPFHRLHSASEYQGHGVGLVTCLRVVQRHGGRIWPVSEVGAGTTIWFTLPGVPADEA